MGGVAVGRGTDLQDRAVMAGAGVPDMQIGDTVAAGFDRAADGIGQRVAIGAAMQQEAAPFADERVGSAGDDVAAGLLVAGGQPVRATEA